MRHSFESYEEVARKQADAMNVGDTLEAAHLEQKYKVMRSQEDGWHPHTEKRQGDALAAELAHNTAYSNRRK